METKNGGGNLTWMGRSDSGWQSHEHVDKRVNYRYDDCWGNTSKSLPFNSEVVFIIDDG